jgi:hypothetical protein
MAKLYYSDGREVRGGDTVRDLDYDPNDKYAEEYFYISEHEGEYSIHAPMGCLGNISLLEGYEFVSRCEEDTLDDMIETIDYMLNKASRGSQFRNQLLIAIEALNIARHSID